MHTHTSTMYVHTQTHVDTGTHVHTYTNTPTHTKSDIFFKLCRRLGEGAECDCVALGGTRPLWTSFSVSMVRDPG